MTQIIQADRDEALEMLKRWLAETPRYEGDDPRAQHYRRNVRALETAIAAIVEATLSTPGEGEPIAMLLFCPSCGLKHVDEPDERTPDWTNPSHRSHLCHGCGCIWRPADVPTNGVAQLATRGKADTFDLNEVASLSPSPAEASENWEVEKLLRLIETADEHGDEEAIVEQAAKVRESLASLPLGTGRTTP